MYTRLLILLVCFVAGWAGTAFAQADERQHVRRIPTFAPLGYQPGGFRAGTMQIFPSLGIAESYDDNIFSTSGGKVDDFITIVSPEIKVQSNLQAHEFGFIAGADIGFYAENDAEDYQDVHAGIDGRYDLSRTNSLYGGVGFRRAHDKRGDPSSAAGINPGIFRVTSMNVGAYVEPSNRLNLRLDGTFDWLDFDDVTTTAGIINHDDRDRIVPEGTARLGYNLVPGTGKLWEVFGQAAVNGRRYSSGVDDAGIDRDSIGYEASVGLVFDLTDIGFQTFEVGAGYLVRDYDSAALSTLSGATFGVLARYAASEVTTLTASANRFIQETTIAGSSGILQTVLDASVDHFFQQNLAVNAGGGFTNNDYEGISRSDDTFTARVGLKYYINRNFDVNAGYTYTNRQSPVAGADYNQNVFLVGLTMAW